MKKFLKSLLLLSLVLALLSCAALAEPTSKSWDKDGTHIYNIVMNSVLSIVEGGDNEWFGPFWVGDEEKAYPEDFKGEWSIVKLSGDDIELHLHVGGDDRDGADGAFKLEKGAAGDSAEFELRYTAPDFLVNPVCKTFTLNILPDSYAHPTDYVYEKTEHEFKTGVFFHTEGGKQLPEGSEKYFKAALECDAQTIWSAEDGSWFGIEPSGEMYGCVMKPGVYKVTVIAWLMDNLRKEVVHTFTITGEPAEEEIDEFVLNEPEVYINRLEDEDADWEQDICWVNPRNPYGRDNDEYSLEIVQTKGPEHPLSFRSYEPWDFKVYVEKGFAAGKYEYNVTLTDVTRGEVAKGKIHIDVNAQEDGLPEGLYYDNIKPVMTLKAGKTLTLKAPKFLRNGNNMPDNHFFYLYQEEDIPYEISAAMFKEDHEYGKHSITGVEAGTYTIHCGLNMFDNSRHGGEAVFTLVVEPAGGTAVQKVDIIPDGTDENPFQLVVGGKFKLKAEISPKNAKNKKVIWTSDNPGGVTVNAKGVVQGMSEYSRATIFAHAADGSGAYDSIVVDVIPAQATKLAMNKKKANLKVGKTLTLNVKYTPKTLPEYAKGIHWVSDNSTVAEVENDVVTAKAPGKAVIYAYAMHQDGWALKDVFAKCTVTIK